MGDPNKCETLFVIGAGAGYDYKMPMGEDLISGIAHLIRLLELSGHNSLDKPTDLDELLWLVCGKDEVRARRAVARIERGLVFAKSIDTLLTDTNDPDVGAVGKVLIAKVLSNHEASATYFTSQGRIADAISPMTSNGEPLKTRQTIRDTWMPSFFRELRAGQTPEAFANRLRNTAVITFNYDRLLEHFLNVAIGQYDGLSPPEAKAVREELRIIHPYGVLASVGVPICSINDDHILDAPDNIKTYDEAIDEDADEQIKGLAASATKIIFLGFGFHEQNMRLLGFPRIVDREHRTIAFGTSNGISERRKTRIISGLVRPGPNAQYLMDSFRSGADFSFDTCKDLIDEHGDAFFS